MFASSEVLGTPAVMCVSLGQRPFHMLMAQRLCGVVRPSCHGKLVAKVSVLEHSQNQRCERKCFKTRKRKTGVCEWTNGIRFPVRASYLTWSH